MRKALTYWHEACAMKPLILQSFLHVKFCSAIYSSVLLLPFCSSVNIPNADFSSTSSRGFSPLRSKSSNMSSKWNDNISRFFLYGDECVQNERPHGWQETTQPAIVTWSIDDRPLFKKTFVMSACNVAAGGRAGHLLIRRFVVWALVAVVCVPKHPWSRDWKLAWMGVNEACFIKGFECSRRVAKHHIRTSPFNL